MSSVVAVVGEDGGAKSWRLVRWRMVRAFGTKLRWERDFTTRSKTKEDEKREEHRWKGSWRWRKREAPVGSGRVAARKWEVR